MCGRYVLKSSPRRIREQFGIEDGHDTSRSAEWHPRFNRAPSLAEMINKLAEYFGRSPLDGSAFCCLVHLGAV